MVRLGQAASASAGSPVSKATPPPIPAIASRRVNGICAPKGNFVIDRLTPSRTTLAAGATYQRPQKPNPAFAAVQQSQYQLNQNATLMA
jgi:hypothetical protein